jgi:hypothetical protein
MMIMLGKTNIHKKGRRPASLAVSMLVTAVAVLFVLSFTHSAVAAENMSTLKGEVIAVDSYAKTLTVSSDELPGGITFSSGNMTNVIRCYQNRTIGDIEVGERVAVRFHEEYGNLMADAIDIAPVFLACYDQ